MEFLPSDYESPKSNSNYFKLQDGENKIRILSKPILGWLDWKDKKPLRFRMNAKPTHSIDPNQAIKHFWTMIIWDYAQKKICIFEMTQASIWKRIETLSVDEDWGAPYRYDLKITKSGSQKDTKYTILPVAPKEIWPEIRDAFKELPIDLEELFKGGDPFNGVQRTLGFWEIPSAISKDSVPDIGGACVSKEEAQEIEETIERAISPYDKDWRAAALRAFKIDSFEKLEKRLHDLMIKRIDEKREKILSEDIPF